jgi:hypothetical protein
MPDWKEGGGFVSVKGVSLDKIFIHQPLTKRLFKNLLLITW